MDSQRNVVEGTPFQAIVEDFAAISKDNAVLHALLQFLPDRGHLQQVDGAPEDLEINHRRFASTARLEICLSLRSYNQLYGLYCEKGIFLG